MSWSAVLEFDEEAGCFSAVCPELPGCCSDGDTEEEARANLMEAIDLYLMPPALSPGLPDGEGGAVE